MGWVRGAIGTAVVGGVAVFAGTGAFEDKTERNESGEIVESGGIGAFVLHIGDCVQLPGLEAMTVESFEGVPCSSPHDAEVYAEFSLTGSEFSRSRIDQESADGCLFRWQAAIGTDYQSDLERDFNVLSPTQESWAEDDRVVTCLVMSVDGSPRVGSDLL